MRIYADDPDAYSLSIHDPDTGEMIEDVMWCDEEAGELGIAAKDDRGEYLTDPTGRLVARTVRRPFRVVDRRKESA